MILSAVVLMFMMCIPQMVNAQTDREASMKAFFQTRLDEINTGRPFHASNYRMIEDLAKEGCKEAQDFLRNPDKYLTEAGKRMLVLSGKIKENPTFTTPEKMGYSLTRSTTLDGIKCDHYEKDGNEYRTFKKNNGDYMTFKEDPDGFNRAPGEHSVGFYRMTTSDNVVITNDNEYGEVKVTLKNGNVLKMKNLTFDWKSFSEGFSFYEIFPNTLKQHIEEVYLVDNPNKGYTVFNDGKIIKDGANYICDDEGNFKLFSKTIRFEGTSDCLEIAAGSSEVVSAKKTDNGKEVTFANGDKIVLITSGTPPFHTYDLLGEGTVVHKKNGLFKIKNGKMNFTMNDGSIFVGFFKEQIVNGSYDAEANPIVLKFDELTPWDGTIQLADGTMDELTSGQSKKALLKAQQADETKAINEIKAKLNKLGQKYGAANINYLKTEGIVKVGFSVAMIKEYIEVYNEYSRRLVPPYNDYWAGTLVYYEPTKKDVMRYGSKVQKAKIGHAGVVMSTFLVNNGKVVEIQGTQSSGLISMKKLK